MKFNWGFLEMFSFGFLLLFATEAAAQGKAEKDKIRIGYAARAVTHSLPFLAQEAGFFRDEGTASGSSSYFRCGITDGAAFGRYGFSRPCPRF